MEVETYFTDKQNYNLLDFKKIKTGVVQLGKW